MMSRQTRTNDTVEDIIHYSAQTQDELMRAEVALYVTEMSGELAKMARASGLQLLAYFLEMAMAEGRAEAEKNGAPPQART
jgi:hypothetical protein